MTRQTPLWLQAGSYPAAYDRRLLGALWPAPAVSGCAVTTLSSMSMNVAPGTVVAPTANNTGSVLCYSDANETVTATTAPASGQSRIDLVVCQPRGNDLDGGANNDFVFSVIAGVAATTGSQVAPAVPAGAVALAQVLIPGGSASITAANITDRRAPALSPMNNPYKASLARASVQSMPVGSGTLVMDTAVFDPLNMLSGGALKVPVVGYWLFAFGVSLLPGSAGTAMQANLQVNGGLTNYGNLSPASLGLNPASTGTAVRYSAAGDVWTVGIYHNSSGALNTGGGGSGNFLQAHLLST